MPYLVASIILFLMLVISGITNIQYFRKIKVLEKNNDEEKKIETDKVDNYLFDLKTRTNAEIKSLTSKKKKGYFTGKFRETDHSGNVTKLETNIYIELEDEYESGDIKASIIDIEYVKYPGATEQSKYNFDVYIKKNFVSLIKKETVKDITWLVPKGDLNKKRLHKFERLLEIIEEEEKDYDENNKKISKEK